MLKYFLPRRIKRIVFLLLYGLLLFACITYWRLPQPNINIPIKDYLAKNEWLLKTNDKHLIGTRNQTCVHPNLPLWNKDIEKIIEISVPVKCSRETDWVYTGSGKFYISLKAVKNHGEIKCSYEAIVNDNEEFKILDPVYPMLNGSDLKSDAFKVYCKASDGKTYSNTHACIAPQSPRMAGEYSSNSERFNVLILGLDSTSRQMYMRMLPKTYKYFTEVLGGSLLEGYNIVGDGTTQALMPLLSGKRETEIPETRRDRPGASFVDEHLEFVWTRYEKKGYVTQWAEDTPESSTFNLRLVGFKSQPVIHYLRPFYLSMADSAQSYMTSFLNLFKEKRKNCLGSRTTYQVYLDWMKEGLETNKGKNFFSFGFISSYSHNDNSDLVQIDDDNVEFLKYLRNENILKNTFLVMMSDHGLRYGQYRMTEQGKLEERMPYFGVYIPAKFRAKYPDKYTAFMQNLNRLVVPSDIHKTLLELIDETPEKMNRSVYSLFSPIPEKRTCADADIDPHWCACLKTESVSVSNQNVVAATNKVISFINDLLKNVSSLCHGLTLQKVMKASALGTDTNVLKFKGSSDRDGRVADFSDKLSAEFIHYLITFETAPSSAIFEASVFMNVKTGEITAKENEISRLNSYNDAAKCIHSTHPSLRPYCYCR
ncbi:uncharacterized protein LOC132741603 [Ruditapes philippinarum]|uniref:uncharacterized protein LOC132741603 n=1 Tax=Ruditapes philippinarum TaxID=129788 RepID=UPI00295C0E46|nr:uncharacterized protein LOC132741603 [Ruditapes philippinarum]XP_060585797.1 uncharacterized protein LOC132741603 [Ruditapes philippinarum]